jgi:head-tail adaptor
MSYEATLTLTSVQVQRDTETFDGMGGTTTSSTITTLSKAAIYQQGSMEILASGQIKTPSTHTLACLASDDIVPGDKIIYEGDTYDVVGKADDVLQKGKVKTVPLRLTE